MQAAMPLARARPDRPQEAIARGGSVVRMKQRMSEPANPGGCNGDMVRVFDADPDLLGGLDASTTDLLRRRVVAPMLWIDAGPWAPPPCPAGPGNCFGLLVLDGLIIRSLRFEGRNCPELIGAGDVLRPWDGDDQNSIPASVFWAALERTTVAILDDRFVAMARRWPTIMSQLLSRTVQRSRTLAFQLAIVHVRHAETRLRMLLWHLADRWGRVTSDGVHLPLALTHETLADLACMRRPTASTALQRLTRNGELERRPGGGWLLTGDPPDRLA